MNSVNLRGVFSIVFFFSTLICSLIPMGVFLVMKKYSKSKTSSGSSHVKNVSKKILISSISCFGGGVFLGACLLDLLPEVIHHINTTLKNEFKYDNENKENYPIGEIFIVLGFFIVLFVEQMILSFRSSTQNSISTSNKTSSIMSHKDHEKTSNGDGNEQLLLRVDENSLSTSEHQHCVSDTEHNVSTNTNELTTTRNLLMILSLVIHSVFEGIAVGTLNDYKTILQLALAILVHKSIIAFSVGLKLISSTTKRLTFVACIIFASATPIGILFMLSMQEVLPENRSTKVINDILRAFACGTFFYITFFDVLPHELNDSSIPKGKSLISKAQRLIKTFCVFLGFVLTAVLIIVTK